MNVFETIIDFLSHELNKVPTMYGWFHILFLVIFTIITVLCIKRLKNSSVEEMNRFLRTSAVIMLIFEVYKQLLFSVEGSVWDYQWYIFPFQFCSVPMYLMLIVSFFKKGKVKDFIYAFLGTYSLFGGLAVMLYPTDVFISTLGISIQTMVHHGIMVVVGITLLATNHIRLERKQILKAAFVFGILGSTAFLLNIVFHNVDGTFNMFFIGPYYDTHLPILNLIEANLGYIPFLLSYFLGFTLVAYLVLLSAIFLKNKQTATGENKEKYSST